MERRSCGCPEDAGRKFNVMAFAKPGACSCCSRAEDVVPLPIHRGPTRYDALPFCVACLNPDASTRSKLANKQRIVRVIAEAAPLRRGIRVSGPRHFEKLRSVRLTPGIRAALEQELA
jgi:hypothetical protein